MSNTERIQANNAELREAIEMAEKLPDASEGGTPTPTQEKTVYITENGTHTVIPDDGYALSKVAAKVSVPIPDGYIVPSGELEITENGEYDITDKASVIVAVEEGGGGRSRSYDITLAQASGWVMLTALDADVLAHINDPGLIVTLRRIGDHAYAFYAGTVFTCGNSQIGAHGDQLVYGIASRLTSETAASSGLMLSPANNTERPRVAKGMGEFQVQDGAYYIRPGDGFIAAGGWRLVFNW